jgi:GT2 family glycosyltransferase
MRNPGQEHLSVVMPVYNALPYLDAAVQSVLNQSFTAFEFIILDDCSTDGSSDRLHDWAARDRRIRLLRSDRNLGPVGSSNLVVAEATGSLIARMDADDVSYPERLERQLGILKQQPDTGLVGTLCEIIDAEGRVVRGADYWRLQARSWFAPFPHGSVMFRKSIFAQIGGYREACAYWEDVDLFLRMASAARVTTIPDVLYQHRHSTVSTRIASNPERVERALSLMYDCLAALEHGRSYDELLEPNARHVPHSRIDARALVSLGSTLLWSGGRPHLLRRAITRSRLDARPGTIGALAWTAWAALNPRSLRAFLTHAATRKNRRYGGDGPPQAVEWMLPRPLPEHSRAPKQAQAPDGLSRQP